MRRNQSKKLKVCVMAVLAVLAVAVISPHVFSWVKAAVITHGVVKAETIPSETGVKGTKTNPFVVLEIVPYEGYAEIGYQIEGCEPVNLDLLRYSDDMIKVMDAKAATVTKEVQYQFADEKGIHGSWVSVSETKTLYGYYERVADNTGIFREVVSPTSGKLDYVKVGTNQGNLVWKTVFGMTQAQTQDRVPLQNIGDRVYTDRTDSNCKKGEGYTYTHSNNFLKNVLNIPDNQIRDYQILVKTVEPSELNANLDWIERADLISISPKSHIADMPSLWAQYKLSTHSVVNSPPNTFGTTDLSWDAVLRIFNKVAIVKDYAGLIMDWTVYTNPPAGTSKNVISKQYDYYGGLTNYNQVSQPGNRNNVYKLALMLRTMSPQIFYNLFLNTNNGTESPKVQNGLFVLQTDTDAKNYWTQSTFMPAGKNGEQGQYSQWLGMWDEYHIDPAIAQNVSVLGRVYTYNGDCSLTQDFTKVNMSSNQYTKELYDYVGGDTAKLTPQNAVRYILSSGTVPGIDKVSIKVLDIEPTKDFELNAFRVRMMVPTFTGAITIVPMTSAEYVGKIEDLNTTYDMIYLGMNCGGYTTSSQLIDGQTMVVPNYNDNTLDGKIYLHVGDLVKGNKHGVNWISGCPVNTMRLPGNDFTARKSQDLYNYYLAGYPILTEASLYNTNTTRTKKLVDVSSYIYDVVDRMRTEGKKNLISTLDSHADAYVFDYLKSQKPVLNITTPPKEYKGTMTGNVIANENYINYPNLSYKKLIFRYNIASRQTTTYTVKLYIDANADGRFSDTELNMIQDGIEPNRDLIFRKELAPDYFGVVPWKLEIVDEHNPLLRDNVTGFSAVKQAESQKQTIRILQINQNDNYAGSLQQNYNRGQKFYSFIKDLNDFNVEFTTISKDKFQDDINWFGSNPFKTGSAALKEETDQLKDYDMLILGFADMYGAIKNQNALSNLQYFIDKGRSVLLTHDVSSFNNNSGNTSEYGYYFNVNYRDTFGMDRYGIRNSGGVKKSYNDTPESPVGTIYPQQHGYTYYAVKRNASSESYDQIMTYAGLSSRSDDASPTTAVSQVNSGQLTQYPYVIDKSFTVSKTHGQYYQLNLDDPGIVVWYTLEAPSGTSNTYSVSPRDAANNYYIYNKGNITYSGVGHSLTSDLPSFDLSDMEVKLFINTMVAAYKTGIKEPTIEILNEEDCVFSPADTVYTPGDVLQIDFIPWDYNLQSLEIGVKVTLPDGAAFDIYDKNGNKVTAEFTSNLDGSKSVKLRNGNTYSIRYKKSDFYNVNLRKITFQIENSANGRGSEELNLRESVLFDLY